MEDVNEMSDKIQKEGEWKVFPFVIHDLISNGRVQINHENKVFIDGKE